MSEAILNITVITNASRDEIIKLSEDNYKVKVTVLPIKGKANKRVEEMLADYFGISKNQVQIVQGEKNKNKLVYIKLP